MNASVRTSEVTETAAPERRGGAPSKLVVVDLASVFPGWTGPVPPEELIARSALLRTLAEARRDGDVYLIGAPMDLAWSAAQVFENAAVVVESDDPGATKELSGEFLEYEKTGSFGELVVVSGDRRFLDVVNQFKEDGRTVRVLTTWEECDVVLAGEANLTVFFPSFDEDSAS